MIYELLTKEQIQFGYQRFLEEHPEVKIQIDLRVRETAIILDIEISDLWHIETANAISQRAYALGIDSFEYLLQFAINNSAHRQHIRQWRDELNHRMVNSNKQPTRRNRKKQIKAYDYLPKDTT
jgi:post-segregation antitoxin (ccd killing protein)